MFLYTILYILSDSSNSTLNLKLMLSLASFLCFLCSLSTVSYHVSLIKKKNKQQVWMKNKPLLLISVWYILLNAIFNWIAFFSVCASGASVCRQLEQTSWLLMGHFRGQCRINVIPPSHRQQVSRLLAWHTNKLAFNLLANFEGTPPAPSWWHFGLCQNSHYWLIARWSANTEPFIFVTPRTRGQSVLSPRLQRLCWPIEFALVSPAPLIRNGSIAD